MKSVLLLFCLSVALLSSLVASARPNFLLIIADDSTWSDYGFAGSKEVRTPNLDALRAEGLYLDHMFTPATTCSPSRHALYTGLDPIRSGAYPNHTRVYDGTKSLFTHLKGNGYRVALQNKSHVGPAASFPYEYIKGADDLTATRKFVTRDKEQPWFLVFASNDPHSPWNRGPKYDPSALTIPPYLHDNATTRELLAKYYGEITRLDEQVGDLMKLLTETQSAEDTLVLFVSEQGSSFPYGGKWSLYDNGIRVSALVRWPGKVKPGGTSHAFASYTDVAPTFLEAAGIDPTKIDTGCPDANGATGFDGRSFLALLTGGTDRHRDQVFSQHTTVGINGFKAPYPMRAVRDRRYKYIRNLAPENTFEIGGIHKSQPFESWQADANADPALAKKVDFLFHRPGEELYDLDNDRYEERNLAEETSMAEIKARLRKELDAWMAQQGDKGMETEMQAKSRQGGGEEARKRKPKAAAGS